MSQDITRDIIAQLPAQIEPAHPEIDVHQIKRHLHGIERQQFVLAIAKWVHANTELLEHVTFKVRVDDGRLYLEGGEVKRRGEYPDLDYLDANCRVEEMVSNLDEIYTPAMEDRAKQLLGALNRGGWAPWEAWKTLEDYSPIMSNADTGAAWLGRHRAAWQAAALEDTTTPATEGKPRPRI